MSASIDAGSGAGFRAVDEGVGLGAPVVGEVVTGGAVVVLPAYAVGPGPVVPPPRSSVGPAVVQAPSRTPAVRLATRARVVRTTRVSPGTAEIPSPLQAFVPHPRPAPTDGRPLVVSAPRHAARHAGNGGHGIPKVVGRRPL